MSKGEKKARRVSKVEMLAGEGSWTENIAEGQMRLSAPSFSGQHQGRRDFD